MAPRVIVALDYADLNDALALVDELTPGQCRVKVGFELFAGAGPAAVRALVERGFDVFLDLKFHDIPTTVAQACRAAAGLGVWMVNVHALGGVEMMRLAGEALTRAPRRPLLTAVTVLTSHSGHDLGAVGLPPDVGGQVMRLARLAREAGLDGVVCSALEAGRLREELGDDLLLVTPGIRPARAGADDQRRVVTPGDALAWGADYLVVGRPVTRAENPREALEGIRRDIGES